MSPDAFKEMVSDLLKVSTNKIKVPNKIPIGGWTVADILLNDKLLNTEQGQIITDILFWHQWWEAGHNTACAKCSHKLDVHIKNNVGAECRYCNCICEIDTGVYIVEGDITVIQSLSKLYSSRR